MGTGSLVHKSISQCSSSGSGNLAASFGADIMAGSGSVAGMCVVWSVAEVLSVVLGHSGLGVRADVVFLDNSHCEGGSAHPQGVIDEVSQGMVTLLQQQHLA